MGQITIDGEKLRALLLDKGIKPSEASKAIGFASNYWSKAMSNRTCSEVAAKALFMRLGIRQEDYQIDDEIPFMPDFPKQTEMEIPTVIDVQKAGLTAEDVRAAVREGVLDAAVQIAASEDITRALNKLIYNAVHGAIINAARLIKGA